jgi:hypothetical protein
MISNAMFERFFLPGLARECQFLDRSIYHLDGPGALRHLDSILSIRELDAVQWVFGAGNEGYGRWVDVYRRIQGAGKGVEVICTLEEIDRVIETLSPKGTLPERRRGSYTRGWPRSAGATDPLVLGQTVAWCHTGRPGTIDLPRRSAILDLATSAGKRSMHA